MELLLTNNLTMSRIIKCIRVIVAVFRLFLQHNINYAVRSRHMTKHKAAERRRRSEGLLQSNVLF